MINSFIILLKSKYVQFPNIPSSWPPATYFETYVRDSRMITSHGIAALRERCHHVYSLDEQALDALRRRPVHVPGDMEECVLHRGSVILAVLGKIVKQK